MQLNFLTFKEISKIRCTREGQCRDAHVKDNMCHFEDFRVLREYRDITHILCCIVSRIYSGYFVEAF